jgi:hypothetical protein
MSRSDVLIAKSKQFRGLVKDATRRYGIPGRVDEEELLQECLILINELMDKYPDCDPDSEGFSALMKTAFYRRVISLVRPHLTDRRNYHLERHSGGEEDAVNFEDIHAPTSHDEKFFWLNMGVDPSESAALNECVELIDEDLPEDTQKLFAYLRSLPSDVKDRMEEYNNQERDFPEGKRKMKSRCRDPYNQMFISHYFGWKKAKTRYHLNLIQQKAKETLNVRS